MPVNRFLRPQQLQYQSQFVQEKIPWDLLQAKAEKKQNERDTFLNSAYKLGEITPAGVDYVKDHFGKQIQIGDYSESVAEVEGLHNELNAFAKDFSNTELNRDSYSKYAELQKRYNEVKLKNDLRTKRAEGFNALYEQRTKDKVTDGEYRAFDDQKEIENAINQKTYIPKATGHYDVFDSNKWTNDALAGIKSEVTSSAQGASAGYIRSREFREISAKKIKNAFDGAYNASPELQRDIAKEAEQLTHMYGESVALEDGTKMSTVDFVKQKRYQEMLANANKFVFSDLQQSMSSDTSYWKDLERTEKLANEMFASYRTSNNAGDFFGIGNIEIAMKANIAKSKLPEIQTAMNELLDENGKVKVGEESKYEQLVAQQQMYTLAKDNYARKFETKENVNTSGKKILQEMYDAAGKVSYTENGVTKDYLKEKFNDFSKTTHTAEEWDAFITTNASALKLNKYENSFQPELQKNYNPEADSQTGYIMFNMTPNSLSGKAYMAQLNHAMTIDSHSYEVLEGTLSKNNGLDINKGFSFGIDDDGNYIAEAYTTGGTSVFDVPQKVKIKIDDRTQLGQQLLNKVYSESMQNYRVTKNSYFLDLANKVDSERAKTTTVITENAQADKLTNVYKNSDALQEGATTSFKMQSANGQLITFDIEKETLTPAQRKAQLSPNVIIHATLNGEDINENLFGNTNKNGKFESTQQAVNFIKMRSNEQEK